MTTLNVDEVIEQGSTRRLLFDGDEVYSRPFTFDAANQQACQDITVSILVTTHVHYYTSFFGQIRSWLCAVCNYRSIPAGLVPGTPASKHLCTAFQGELLYPIPSPRQSSPCSLSLPLPPSLPLLPFFLSFFRIKRACTALTCTYMYMYMYFPLRKKNKHFHVYVRYLSSLPSPFFFLSFFL